MSDSPQSLRDFADQCRRLAASTTDSATADSLRMLADDFELQARQAENANKPINPAV